MNEIYIDAFNKGYIFGKMDGYIMMLLYRGELFFQKENIASERVGLPKKKKRPFFFTPYLEKNREVLLLIVFKIFRLLNH